MAAFARPDKGRRRRATSCASPDARATIARVARQWASPRPDPGYPPRALPPAFLALLLLGQQPVLADAPSPGSPAVPAPGPARGILPTAAAIVPGLLLHGSGHFVAGDRRTALRLLAAQGIGLGGMVAGLAGLAVTGASPRFVSPIILLTAAGAALFTTSALADLYGVLAPPGGTGAAPADLPALEAGGGALLVRNPVFPYRWLAAVTLDARAGRWRLWPRLYGTANGQTVRAELRGSYRLTGLRPSSVDLSGALVHHREGGDVIPFGTTLAELSLDGRTRLDALAPSLAGSFLDWSGGLAFGGMYFGGAVDALEATDLLLARFGFGFFLGRSSDPRGEVVFGYDHRHDDFAGGLKMPGLGSGPAGSFGLEASIYVRPRWGLRAVARAGSAHVVGLSLLYRRPPEGR